MTVDVAAIGIGPFNLALAALADEVPELSVRAYDSRAVFDWHPGLMFETATLQVNFLADLVTLVAPTSHWSFLNYLAAQDRMYAFYIAERFHMPRREYAAYCRWVADNLARCEFGTTVTALRWSARRQLWELELASAAGRQVQRARHVVLGVGSRPQLPPALRGMAGSRLSHSAGYLPAVRLWEGDGVRDVTVVGSGQSGAEVFLDLLRRQRGTRWSITWLTRTPMFAPLDYTKLVLEYTTPEYMRYFHGLAPEVRDRLLQDQWQLYKGIDTETIDAIHAELYDRLIDGDRPPVRLLPATALCRAEAVADGYRLGCRSVDTGQPFELVTGAVVAATGYAAEAPAFLEPVRELIAWDDRGRYDVTVDHRVVLDSSVTGGLYVQNAELHTHGAAAPDLGIGAYRSALILNRIAGREAFRLPKQTAFQTFGGV